MNAPADRQIWPQGRDIHDGMDTNVDVDALIYNAFTVLDMMHDEGRHGLDDNENAGVEPDRENVVGDSLHGQRNLQQNGGNVWTNNVRKAENEDSAHEGEELEEDIEAMPEAPLDPPSGPDQDARDASSRVPLYRGAQLLGLAASLHVLNCCCTHGTSNTLINELLSLLKMSILPQPNTLPSNEHEAFKLLQKLRSAYKVIHACPKGHMLLCGFHENDQNCHKCRANRFKAVGTTLVPQKV